MSEFGWQIKEIYALFWFSFYISFFMNDTFFQEYFLYIKQTKLY